MGWLDLLLAGVLAAFNMSVSYWSKPGTMKVSLMKLKDSSKETIKNLIASGAASVDIGAKSIAKDADSFDIPSSVRFCGQ